MSPAQLLRLWPSQIGRMLHKWSVQRAITIRERDLELTNREIADRLEARRVLTADLMNLKRELRSI
jgi:hypothetical protein